MNIFMSYGHDDMATAQAIVDHLEGHGKKCWIAPRDVVVSYAYDIIEAISKCNIFILVLSKTSATSKHVLNEVEAVYRFYSQNSATIIPFKVDDAPLTGEMFYYLQRIQHINAYAAPFDVALSELERKINLLIKEEPAPAPAAPGAQQAAPVAAGMSEETEVRLVNRYYDVDDRYENKRLKTEAEILYPIEKGVYDKMLAGLSGLNALIVSTMYAPGVMNKVNRPEMANIIGLCYNQKACLAANYDYENDHVKFYHQDAEDPELEDKLEQYMEERGVKGFDFVDITMGFLDWEKPFRVIKTIAHFLNPGAQIYVRDVDDSVCFAFPDEKEYFKHLFRLYKLDPLSGYRSSGRRVYSYLKKIGAKKVVLEYAGVNTADLEYRDVERMCFSYCGFVPNDFAICVREHPENEEYKKALEWCNEHYDDLEESFLDEDFIFNSGYFIYSAKFKD